MAELALKPLNIPSSQADKRVNFSLNSEKKRVLCLSHTDDLSKIIQLGLELLCDWQVVTAKPSCDVIKIARQICPDVILIDTVIDDPNILELIKTLRANRTTKSTPIFILVETMRYYNYSFFDLGVVAAIAKPFDPIELVTEISLHLNWDQSQI